MENSSLYALLFLQAPVRLQKWMQRKGFIREQMLSALLRGRKDTVSQQEDPFLQSVKREFRIPQHITRLKQSDREWDVFARVRLELPGKKVVNAKPPKPSVVPDAFVFYHVDGLPNPIRRTKRDPEFLDFPLGQLWKASDDTWFFLMRNGDIMPVWTVQTVKALLVEALAQEVRLALFSRHGM